MFGSKKAKNEQLDRMVDLIREQGEITQGELACSLNVSLDAVEDYLATLHERGVPLCQKGRKLSLLEHWFGKSGKK